MNFVIATNNPKKLEELQAILARVGASAISLAQAGVTADPEETGATFEENAMIKAKAAVQASKMPAIADDSGLEVRALGGRPGVFSARYGQGTGMSGMELLLRKMDGQKDRAARFVSAVVCLFPDGRSITVRGECEGEIIGEPRGNGGFGYDPVFYLPEYKRTFAEMSAEMKNGISHRGIALEKLARELAALDKEKKYADK